MVVFSIPFKLFRGCILNQVKMGNKRLRNAIVQWVTIIMPRCYKGAEHDFTTCDMFLGQHLCWLWNNIVIGKRLGLVEPLQSDFAAVGTNCWFDWAWFLHSVTDEDLVPCLWHAWGHFIYSDITDLIVQILFKLNWDGWCHHKIQ